MFGMTPCHRAAVGVTLFAALTGPARTINSSQGLSQSDWHSIRQEYERHRHSIVAGEHGHHARNPRQQWLVRFDGRGFLLQPDRGDWRWGLELIGVQGKARVSADKNRITYRWSADLEEWFINDSHGLEHGFTLRKPADLRLAVRGGLLVSGSGSTVQFADRSGAAVMSYSNLKAWDADGRVLPARMEAQVGNVVHLIVDDRGARYPVIIDPIAQTAYLKASNTGADGPFLPGGDKFGTSVAASGDTVIVGAPAEDSNATGVNGNQADNSAGGSGAVYVFTYSRDSGMWNQEAYLKASNAEAYDYFGGSVAISGNTVVVGAQGECSAATGVNGNQADNNASTSGAAYVFTRSGTVWGQEAYLKASNTEPNDWFGSSISIWGSTLIVGASNEASKATGVNGDQADNDAILGAGAAYLFRRVGLNWFQEAYLKASNTEGFNPFVEFQYGDNFGHSVAVSGGTVVIGAPYEDSAAKGVNGNQNNNRAVDSGAAYVFAIPP
jgi:hypothetical protein